MIEAEPFFFGPLERPLFGWLHRPSGAAATNIGLVFCNAFGHEAMASHRTVRRLAEAAALSGIHVLRFDYDGCGNSAGSDVDPERVSAWIANARAALNVLRAQAGTSYNYIAGLRLGAWIAAAAAADRDDVVGLIMIAPGNRPGALVRELRAVQFAMQESTEIEADVPEYVGFQMTRQTAESISALDQALVGHVPRALVLSRRDLPAPAGLEVRLANLATEIVAETFEGGAEMMLDPHQTTVPRALIETVITWVLAASVASSGGTAPRSHADSTVQATSIRRSAVIQAAGSPAEESITTIPGAVEIFGILSAPVARGRSKGIVLLLNAGAAHHVGPNRVYVLLGRTLAALGYHAYRFDLSGLGDSGLRPGERENTVYGPSAVDDIQQVAQHLQKLVDTNELHAAGICSGAYHAIRSALRVRFASIVPINPLTFRWVPGMSLETADARVSVDMQRYRKNAFSAQSWLKVVRGNVDLNRLTRVIAKRVRSLVTSHARNLARILRIPLRDDLGAELAALGRSGTRIQFVFSDDEPGHDLLRVGAGNMLQRLQATGRLLLAFVPNADHTFTASSARQKLASLFVNHFSGGQRP